MAAQFVSIVGGAAVSSSVVLDPSAGRFAVFVSSHAGIEVRVAFAVSSAATEWHRLDPVAISSGSPLPGCGIIDHVASPWMRLQTTGNVSTTVSAAILPVKG